MKYPYVVERILDQCPGLHSDSVGSRVRHCSFVSVEKRYLYFEVPKAACTQMKHLLRILEAGPSAGSLIHRAPLSRRDMYIHSRGNVPLPSLVDLDTRTQMEVLESPDFLRMVIVRNPYQRLVSAWRNRVLLCEPGDQEVYLHVKGGLPDVHNKSVVTFEEFVEYVGAACDLRTCNCHWRRQVDHVFYPALTFNHTVKLERFGDGLQRFYAHLGLESPRAPERRNASFAVGTASYTQQLADTVYRLYRRDFEVFRYGRDSWPAGEDGKVENKALIPEEVFYDEIIERNLVILELQKAIQNLEILRYRASRLHLLPIISGSAAFHSRLKRVARAVRRWTHWDYPPGQRGQRDEPETV